MKYDKLVRDKVPKIIKSRGDSCGVHIAGDDEYGNKLKAKIREEVEEFLDNPCIEELADVLEVVYAIADFQFGGRSELERIRGIKFGERGGFEKRLVLEESGDR
ncbi:MAG: nucleoside triphosphate pyrophosphohydrolase [archaeon]